MTPLSVKEKCTSASYIETNSENNPASYSAPLFRETKSSTTSSSVPYKEVFTRNIDSMLRHRLGENWEKLSTYLNLPCDTIESLSKKYLSFNDFKFQESELDEDGEYYKALSNPNIFNLIQELLLILQDNNITLQELIESLNQCDKYLAHCINIETSFITRPEENLSGIFTSYIFTLWIKNPNRGSTHWGSFLPNTKILPHQQTVFDWAFLNPDKLVVLWYDSVNLAEAEKRDIFTYSDSVSSCLSNIRVLDIRNIDFGNKPLQYEEVSSTGETINTFFLSPDEALHKEDSLVALQSHRKSSRLGLKIDFLRQRLLYEGSSAIESALTKTRQESIPSTGIPCKGVWFDLDYIPANFSSSLWDQADIFIDNSTRALKSSVNSEGQVEFGGQFIQSLLAVSQDRLDILGSCLWVKFDDPERPSHYIAALQKALLTFRHRVGGVLGFKMRTVPFYQGDFIPGFWVGPNSSTYSGSYNPLIDNQSNMPLNTRKAEIANPKRPSIPNTTT